MGKRSLELERRKEGDRLRGTTVMRSLETTSGWTSDSSDVVSRCLSDGEKPECTLISNQIDLSAMFGDADCMVLHAR